MSGLSATRDYTRPRDASAPLTWRIVGGLATAAALVVLAWVVAHWAWHWLAPAAPAGAQRAAEDASPDLARASALFGVATATPDIAVATSSSTDVAGARLLGVFAEAKERGYALLRLPDRGVVLARVGDEIAPEVVVEAITPSSVRLSAHGERRELDLRAPPAPVAPPRPTVGKIAGASASAACAPRAGFSGPVYRLNAELLTGLADKPEAWRDLFQSAGNGLAVRENHAFAAMLGLRPGDRVVSANGVPLASTEDVRVAVLRPLLASQPVEVAGIRDGKPAAWLFVNAGACPA